MAIMISAFLASIALGIAAGMTSRNWVIGIMVFFGVNSFLLALSLFATNVAH